MFFIDNLDVDINIFIKLKGDTSTPGKVKIVNGIQQYHRPKVS